MKRQLIIGEGEVGLGLKRVIKCESIDKGDEAKYKSYEVLHVVFPYSASFVKIVKSYIERFKPELVIIHSTVRVGTTEKCGDICVHSPIRGVHPNLDKGIKTFVKFIGGKKARDARKLLKKYKIKTLVTSNAKNTEAMKLWDTEQYRELILLNKKIWKYCNERGLDFDIVYSLANKSYNEGYLKLGRKNVVRPFLKYIPGKIGGHCVEPNHKLLGGK